MIWTVLRRGGEGWRLRLLLEADSLNPVGEIVACGWGARAFMRVMLLRGKFSETAFGPYVRMASGPVGLLGTMVDVSESEVSPHGASKQG